MSHLPSAPGQAQQKRRLRVVHQTRYRYDQPVPRSLHTMRLRPIEDWRQSVLDHRLILEPGVPFAEYEDVFGNWVARFELTTPYTELLVRAESIVEVLDVDPFAFATQPIRPPSFPLVWMPWERTMLAPYLAPDELPDTQLQALYDYAMSFVTRNRGDLMETLFDVNLSFFRDYKYKPGSTSLETTPFEVFNARAGVCQDFANLFITMARLLGIPARYVCGYVFTGNTGLARAQSDASHAWVQLYIPQIGWKGFDPTNGVLPQLDHVRTGYGRHYRDTAPTSGTIFGSARETMDIGVEVVEIPIDS
jgi:transglutaminase-like putative cysteine protease